MRLRPARPGDAGDLARVHVETWRVAYRGLIDQAFLDSLDVSARSEWWQRMVGSLTVIVGEVESGVEGFCTVGPADEEGWGEVYAIYVSPTQWGRGMGRALLGAGEAALAEAGHVKALLWVLEGNARARHFYEQAGWNLGKRIRLERIGSNQVAEVRYERDLSTASTKAMSSG